MKNEDLDIIAMGTDYFECFREFHEEVFMVYEYYGLEEDDKLSKDAQGLKRRILQYVGSNSICVLAVRSIEVKK